MRFNLTLFLVFLVLISFSIARADDLDEYYRQMTIYFRPLHWIPIIIPRGQEVGNVYDINNLSFKADHALCFPTLPPPQEAPSGGLPTLIIEKNLDEALTLGIKRVAEVSGETQNVKKIKIEFTDARVFSISSLRLANALNVRNCGFLKDQRDATRDERRPRLAMGDLVVGEVLFARKSVHFIYNDQADANASVSRLQKLVQLLGLSVSAKVQRVAAHVVNVEYDKALPIALKPAFVPDGFPMVGAAFGDAPVVFPVKWQKLHVNNPAQQRQIDSLATNLRGSVRSFYYDQD